MQLKSGSLLSKPVFTDKVLAIRSPGRKSKVGEVRVYGGEYSLVRVELWDTLVRSPFVEVTHGSRVLLRLPFGSDISETFTQPYLM